MWQDFGDDDLAYVVFTLLPWGDASRTILKTLLNYDDWREQTELRSQAGPLTAADVRVRWAASPPSSSNGGTAGCSHAVEGQRRAAQGMGGRCSPPERVAQFSHRWAVWTPVDDIILTPSSQVKFVGDGASASPAPRSGIKRLADRGGAVRT